jgi:mannose-6-phosphate isomerase-like protein (cupin superfamily)
MPHVISFADLPKMHSTRDQRARIDLVTEEIFGFTDMRADHITYEPGDTAAAHYHLGARHIWFISEGSGLLHIDGQALVVAKGDVATAGEGEVHWFENPNSEPFAFYELWVPAPTETIWIRDDDI